MTDDRRTAVSYSNIQMKRGTAERWATTNPVLRAGEVGYDTDIKKIKIGDGVTAWNNLPFFTTEPEVQTAMPTGSIIQTALPTAPGGWLFCQGQEVLIAAYPSLYGAITINGTVFNYGTNTNGSGGAGTTHFRLPNLKGRVPVGLDASDTNFDKLGTPTAYVGEKLVGLSTANVPSHTHTFSGTSSTDGSHQHAAYGISLDGGSGSGRLALQTDGNLVWYRGNGTVWATGGGAGGPTQSLTVAGDRSTGTSFNGSHSHTVTGTTGTGSGSGTKHNNVQPYLVTNYMIKT